jgi:hypothetical protein
VLSILEVKEDDDTPEDIVFVVIKFIAPLAMLSKAVTFNIDLLLYLTNAI